VAAAIVDAMNDSAAATKDQRAGPVFYRFQRSFIGRSVLVEGSFSQNAVKTNQVHCSYYETHCKA